MGRFHMNAYENTFRIVTRVGEGTSQTTQLTVLDVSDPDRLHQLGSLPGIAPGEALFATRFVGVAALVEGQPFQGFSEIPRRAPLLEPPQLSLTLQSVEADFEHGRALHLEAGFTINEGGATVERKSRINSPARTGASTAWSCPCARPRRSTAASGARSPT